MSGTIHKEYRGLAKVASRAGWSIEVSKTCHLKWRNPEGRLIAVSAGTPSNPARSLKSLRRELRHGGLDV